MWIVDTFSKVFGFSFHPHANPNQCSEYSLWLNIDVPLKRTKMSALSSEMPRSLFILLMMMMMVQNSIGQLCDPYHKSKCCDPQASGNSSIAAELFPV